MSSILLITARFFDVEEDFRNKKLLYNDISQYIVNFLAEFVNINLILIFWTHLSHPVYRLIIQNTCFY